MVLARSKERQQAAHAILAIPVTGVRLTHARDMTAAGTELAMATGSAAASQNGVAATAQNSAAPRMESAQKNQPAVWHAVASRASRRRCTPPAAPGTGVAVRA